MTEFSNEKFFASIGIIFSAVKQNKKLTEEVTQILEMVTDLDNRYKFLLDRQEAAGNFIGKLSEAIKYVKFDKKEFDILSASINEYIRKTERGKHEKHGI